MRCVARLYPLKAPAFGEWNFIGLLFSNLSEQYRPQVSGDTLSQSHHRMAQSLGVD
jgi:hypothetical protein